MIGEFGDDHIFRQIASLCTTYLDVLIREGFRAVKGKEEKDFRTKKILIAAIWTTVLKVQIVFLLHQLLFASKCFWRQSSQI